MIRSFGNKLAEKVWARDSVRELDADVARRAYDKLATLHAATSTSDLAAIPGNRFEKLQGTDRCSIRVNNKWRVTFRWEAEGPHDVKVEDYH